MCMQSFVALCCIAFYCYAAAVVFTLNLLTTFSTSLRVAKLRKPGFRAKNVPTTDAKQIMQSGHSRSRILESVERR